MVTKRAVTFYYGVPLSEGLVEYASHTIRNPRFFQTYKFTELFREGGTGHYGFLGEKVHTFTENDRGFRKATESDGSFALEVDAETSANVEKMYNQLPTEAKQILEEEGYDIGFYMIWT